MRLSKRLQSIADCVNYYDTIADIGCDHGKLSVYLISKGRCSKVLATDISPKSLEKTQNLAQSKKVSDKIITLCGDGLEPLINYGQKIDLAIIAGLGGYEIIKIIERDKNFIDRYILSPQQNVSILRKKLNEFGYKIINDFIVLDKSKFYDIIEVEKGYQELNELELEWGIGNLKNPSKDFIAYLDKKINLLTQAADNANTRQEALKKELETAISVKNSIAGRL
ncbi:MAG TPA: class I SAM-dependent methyltransferase [Clostridia bacterium]|jgi:tRNA (adenine22-N1)-methyltransferase